MGRMLRNLKHIYRLQEDWARLIAVLNRLLVLYPRSWPEYRDRGLALAEQGQAQRAQADLEIYLARAEDAQDHAAVADRLADLRRAAS